MSLCTIIQLNLLNHQFEHLVGSHCYVRFGLYSEGSFLHKLVVAHLLINCDKKNNCDISVLLYRHYPLLYVLFYYIDA